MCPRMNFAIVLFPNPSLVPRPQSSFFGARPIVTSPVELFSAHSKSMIRHGSEADHPIRRKLRKEGWVVVPGQANKYLKKFGHMG